MSNVRLQKIIAQAGLASRRRAEELVLAGRVRVNGVVARELGARADPVRDRIEVDGRRIVRQRLVYVLLNKPERTVTTAADPAGRATVLDLVREIPARIFPVGRLDYNTTGALLLTNDGELAQALSHPAAQAPRVYRARLEGDVTATELDALRQGVSLDDGVARAQEVFVVSRTDRSTTVQLTLLEGRNHQIHRMAAAIGHRVRGLVRLSFAGLEIDGLRAGSYRQLTGREVARLKRDFRRPHRARERRRRSGPGRSAPPSG